MNPALLHDRLAAERIGLTAHSLLLNIEETPEFVTDLARLIKTSWPNCCGHVNRLEKRGLVVRIQGAGTEYRRVSVCITEAGKEMLRRIEAP